MLPLHPKVRQLLTEGTRKQLQAAGFNPTSTRAHAKTEAVLLQQPGVMASISAKLARRPTAAPVPLRLSHALGESGLRPNGQYFAVRLPAAPQQRLPAAVSSVVEVKIEEGAGPAAGGKARKARKRRALVLDDSDEEEEGSRRPARSQWQVSDLCAVLVRPELPVVTGFMGTCKSCVQHGRACFLLGLPVPSFCFTVLAAQRSGSSKRARRSTTPSSFEPTTEEVYTEEAEAALLEEETQQVRPGSGL